jgi:TolB protein
MAGPGQDEPRSAVPWGKVGHGWALAVDQATSSKPAKVPAGSVILYLVDPLGGRYTLLSSPAKAKNPLVDGELTDWSGDGRRALFVELPISARSAPSEPTYQLDLRTGKFSLVLVAKTVEVLGYTRPRGSQLLAETENYAHPSGIGTLEVLNLNGKVTRRLWHGWFQAPPISSPDGTIVAMPSDNGVHLVSSTGAKLRVLAPHSLCAPLRWWNKATILATCATSGGSDSQNMRLLPVSGAKPVALTPPHPSSGPDEADYNLFGLTSGSYVEAMGATCGNDVVARIEPGGKVKVLKVPGASDANIITATATKLLEVYRGRDRGSSRGCSSPFPSTLAWFNPATGKETIAIPVPKNQAGVMGVVPYFDQGQQ